MDGNFFEHEGAPYCETHFHALKGSLCAGCSKPISGKELSINYVILLGEGVEKDRVCYKCNLPFGNNGFGEKDG